MLSEHPIMAFVSTCKPELARAFYEQVLGLKLAFEDPYAIVFIAHGTRLRVSKVESFTPQPFTVLGWDVPDVASIARALKNKGVSCERYGFLEQDDDGVWAAPSGARVAWFKDPDGNTLSLTQHP